MLRIKAAIPRVYKQCRSRVNSSFSVFLSSQAVYMINSFLKANGRRTLMFFYQEVEHDRSGRQELFKAFIGKMVRKEKLIKLLSFK